MTAAGTPPVRVIRHSLPIWLALIAVVLAGCNTRQSAAPTLTAVKQADPYEELVQAVRDEFRQGTDQAACRRVVDQLNASLPRLPADHRPATPTDSERSALESEFRLQPPAVAEVTRAEYTPVDAYYLEESFLFRDVARALDVDRLPPLARAETALAWVVRNLRPVEPSGPPVPPWFAAMRGSATPVERLFALQALLRQLDVDAAFVGDPGSGPDGVWAVGIVADGQVHLLDARLGVPVPGAEGGVLTLAQARSLSDPFKALALDPKLPYDVTADRAKRAEIVVPVPLSGMSPRMRFLQSLLLEGTARLAAEPQAVRDRIRQAAGADGANLRLVASTLLFNFLPAAEGGGDRTPAGQRPREQFLLQQVPLGLFPPFLQQLSGEPGNRVRLEFIDRVLTLVQPGQAREMTLRGRYRDATDKLVAVQEWAKRSRGTPEQLEKTTRAWADAARAFYAEQSRQERGQGGPGGAVALEELRTNMETLQRDVHGPHAFVEYLVSDEVAAQATYLLALCKQEEAERPASRAESGGPTKSAWASAQRWWSSFVDKYPNRPEASAAKRNLARCLATGGRTKEAKAIYEALAASDLPPHERLACRYLAEQTK